MFHKLVLVGIFTGAYVSSSVPEIKMMDSSYRNSTRLIKDGNGDYQILPMTDFWDNLPKLLELKLLMLGVGESMLHTLSGYRENIKDYGCWCRPFFNATLKGTPIDDMDKACQRFFKSCQCNHLADGSCSAGNGFDVVPISIGMLDENLECLLNQDECHLNACRSFLQLVEDLSIALINTKGTPAKPFHHDSHIESRQSNCKNGRGGTEIEDCCGRNPTHFPFKSDDGRRKCCGTKTIDTKHQQCCNDIPCQVGDLF